MPEISEISISISEIIVTILTIVTASLGFIIKEQREKIKNIQNQLSEKNTKYITKYLQSCLTYLKTRKSL